MTLLCIAVPQTVYVYSTGQGLFNSLTPTVILWVQLYNNILFQTGLSRHL